MVLLGTFLCDQTVAIFANKVRYSISHIQVAKISRLNKLIICDMYVVYKNLSINTTTFCILTGLAEVRKYGGELQRILAPCRHTCTSKNFAECTLHTHVHLTKTSCPPAPANFLCALNFHFQNFCDYLITLILMAMYTISELFEGKAS